VGGWVGLGWVKERDGGRDRETETGRRRRERRRRRKKLETVYTQSIQYQQSKPEGVVVMQTTPKEGRGRKEERGRKRGEGRERKEERGRKEQEGGGAGRCTYRLQTFSIHSPRSI
jgi:hypothetical protein